MSTESTPAAQRTSRRLLRFLVVGGTAYGVQWLAMGAFLRWWPENVAFLLAYVCSVTTHYLLNRFWALPSTRRDTWRQWLEYLGAFVVSLTINFLMYRLCRDVFGLGELWSTAVAVPPSTVVVFLLLNYRVFRR